MRNLFICISGTIFAVFIIGATYNLARPPQSCHIPGIPEYLVAIAVSTIGFITACMALGNK